MGTPLVSVLLAALAVAAVAGQDTPPRYHLEKGWAPAPGGGEWGQVPGMAIDATGRLFAFRRGEPPVIELDADGRVLKIWGERQFICPTAFASIATGISGSPTDGRGTAPASRSSSSRATAGW